VASVASVEMGSEEGDEEGDAEPFGDDEEVDRNKI